MHTLTHFHRSGSFLTLSQMLSLLYSRKRPVTARFNDSSSGKRSPFIGSFDFTEEVTISRTYIRRVQWMWQNFPAAFLDYALYFHAKMWGCIVGQQQDWLLTILFGAVFKLWDAMIFLNNLYDILQSKLYQQELDKSYTKI